MEKDFDAIVERILEKDLRYKEDAYAFVMEALAFTQRKLKAVRHVSSQELLAGIKELIISEFGPMALTVLEHWGIKSTQDFGNIVFNLVENKILSKTEDDNIDTFRDVYDFEEEFYQKYRMQLAKKIGRMRSI